MSFARAQLLAAATLVLTVAACASKPKTLDPSTQVKELEPAPVAVAAADPVPEGTCRGDADCAGGEACRDGRCEAVSSCALVRVGFAFDSSQLDDGAMEGLRQNARCLAERRASSLLVEGHCDERGTVQYNIALGARRAEAVRSYLSNLGVTATFDTISFGEALPVAQGAGEDAWAQNRRAELRLPGERRSDGMVVAGR